MPWMRNRALAAGWVLAVAAAVAGCGASAPGGSSQARSAGAAAIARAAAVSSAAQGYTYTLAMTERASGSPAIQVGATGSYSAARHSGTTELTVHAAGTTVKMQEILSANTIYIRPPASLATQVPGSKPWWEIDLNGLAGSSYLSSLSSLISSSSETSPATYLGYLEHESTAVRNLGSATVDSVATTHYRATLDLLRAGAGLPASAQSAVRRLLTKLPGRILDETAIPANVWIDSAGRVRELTMQMAIVPKGSAATYQTSFDIHISSYGPQPAPAPPPASQTLNLLSLLQSAGGGGGSNSATVPGG